MVLFYIKHHFQEALVNFLKFLLSHSNNIKHVRHNFEAGVLEMKTENNPTKSSVFVL